MFIKKYTFLQTLKTNPSWVHDIIDADAKVRVRPDSLIETERQNYYASTTKCEWVRIRHISGRKQGSEDIVVHICRDKKDHYAPSDENVEVIAKYPCKAHVLFCQDLVGNQTDTFKKELNTEYQRLLADENTDVRKEYRKYFIIEKKKYARKRTVDFDVDEIERHTNKHAGYICFLTNDPTIRTSQDALQEYSTRDYIEKDFDEMKNDLDMNRIRVHTDARMRARLFIQFIAEIYLREIRVRLGESKECKKMTKKQIFANIKSIYKINFKGKYKDVYPTLTKSQRTILEALDINTNN